MTKPLVYIETTIPSFYFEDREEADMVARRNWTRQWWDDAQEHYSLVTSVPVLVELESGVHPNQSEKLALLDTIPLLKVTDEIEEIVQAYIDRKVMPIDPGGDALHLALASFHKCDFLVTWNCKHLANANKYGHIRMMNALLGLHVPLIVTPIEILGSEI